MSTSGSASKEFSSKTLRPCRSTWPSIDGFCCNVSFHFILFYLKLISNAKKQKINLKLNLQLTNFSFKCILKDDRKMFRIRGFIENLLNRNSTSWPNLQRRSILFFSELDFTSFFFWQLALLSLLKPLPDPSLRLLCSSFCINYWLT